MLVRATGVIDFNADPVATDTVTIGDQTYTYIATPSSPNDIDVGSDRDESISNLVAAINGGAGEGTAYGTGTVENPFVTATADLANDEIDLVAKVPGTFGNGIALATSEVDIVILGSEVVLIDGTGDLGDELDAIVSVEQLNAAVLQRIGDLSPAAD